MTKRPVIVHATKPKKRPPKRRKQPSLPATIVYSPTAKRVAALKRWRQLTRRTDD
jgi:hypothetical protein